MSLSWFLLLLVVVLGTVGQLALKYAFHPSQSGDTSLLRILTSPYFWIWFISYVFVTAIWLIVLRTIPSVKHSLFWD